MYVALLWALPTQSGNRFIQFAIEMNHENCHFTFQNWRRDAKVTRAQSGDSLTLLNDHIGSPI